MANDFSSDSNCIALYRFEVGSLEADSKGSETLTGANSVQSNNVVFKEGGSSTQFTASLSHYHYRTDANLGASFPLKSGTSNKTISIARWVRFISVPSAGNFMELGGKTIYTGSARTFAVNVFNSSGTVKVDIELGKTDGTYSENILHASGLSIDTWYHITVGYRDSDKAVRIYLRSDTGTTIGSDISTTAANNIGLFSNSDFMLGTAGSNAAPSGLYFNGYQDECVIFNKLLTATDATNIAKGLYSGTGDSGGQTITATGGSYSQSGTAMTLRVGSPLYLRYRK